MIMDANLELADAVALNTGAAGGYLVGSQIDLGAVHRDVGNGQPAYLVITVDTTATSGGAATAAFELRSDSTAVVDEATGTFHGSTGAIPVASLVAGEQWVIPLPSEGNVYERFLGLIQRTGTAAFTAGKINAFITLDAPAYLAYPDAVN